VLQGKRGLALKTARRYAETESGALPHLLLARVHTMLRDLKSCEAACARAIELATNDEMVGLLTLCGRLMATLGSDQAVAYYERALEQDPNRRPALEGLIRLHLNAPAASGRARAMELAQAWVTRQPDEPQAALFVILARMALEGGTWTAPLIGELNRMTELYPNAHEVRHTLAAAYLATGQHDQARSQIEYLLGATPSDRVALRLAVDASLAHEDAARALRQAHDLVQLYPLDTEATVTLARCQRAAGKLQEAEKTLRGALSGDMHADLRIRAHLALAEVHLAQGRWPDLEAALAPLLEDASSRYRAALLVATRSQSPEDLDRALRFVDEPYEARPAIQKLSRGPSGRRSRSQERCACIVRSALFTRKKKPRGVTG